MIPSYTMPIYIYVLILFIHHIPSLTTFPLGGFMEAVKAMAEYHTVRLRGEERGIQYLLDLIAEGYVDGHIIESMNELDRKGKYKEVVEQACSGEGRGNKFREAKQYIKMYGHSSPRKRGSDSEKRDSCIKASGYLYKALELGKEDDKILEKIIHITEDFGNYKDANEALKRLCNNQFTTWHDLALYYCDVLINRGSAQGYWYKAERIKYFRSDTHGAMKIAKEAEEKGLATGELYEFLGFTSEYVYYYSYFCIAIIRVHDDSII